MNNKNVLVALAALMGFIFLGILVSPLEIFIKLGAGFILAVGEGYIVYRLNLFSEEPNQKIIDALSAQQDVLNTLVGAINQQSEILAAHMTKGQAETINKMNELHTILESIYNQDEKIYAQGKEVKISIQENYAQSLQASTKNNENLVEGIERLSTAIISQEQSARTMLERVEEVCDGQIKMLHQLMDNYESVNAVMKDGQNQVMEAFEKSIGNIGEIQKDNIEELKEAIAEHLDEVDENTHEYISKMTEAINKSQKKVSQDVEDNNKNFTEGLNKSLDNHLGNIGNAMQEMLKQYENIKVYIETLQNGLVDLNEKDMEILKKYLQ